MVCFAINNTNLIKPNHKQSNNKFNRKMLQRGSDVYRRVKNLKMTKTELFL